MVFSFNLKQTMLYIETRIAKTGWSYIIFILHTKLGTGEVYYTLITDKNSTIICADTGNLACSYCTKQKKSMSNM